LQRLHRPVRWQQKKSRVLKARQHLRLRARGISAPAVWRPQKTGGQSSRPGTHELVTSWAGKWPPSINNPIGQERLVYGGHAQVLSRNMVLMKTIFPQSDRAISGRLCLCSVTLRNLHSFANNTGPTFQEVGEAQKSWQHKVKLCRQWEMHAGPSQPMRRRGLP